IASASAPTVRLVRPQGVRETTQGEVVDVEVEARAAPGRDVVQVVLLLDGQAVAADDGPPWALQVTVPQDAATGSDLRLVAQAIDDTGDTAVSDAALLRVLNEAPQARFTAIPFGPRDVRVDARGVTDDYTPVEALQVRFDFEDDGAWDTEWAVEKVAEHQYPAEGQYTLRMQVRDGIGQVSEAVRAVSFQDQRVAFGDIESEFWTGSVTVTGTVRVLPGHTLTIGEGTLIQVVQVDQNGDGVGEYGLDVDGQLVVQGTAEAPVVFQEFGDDPSAGAWRGIVLRGDQASSLTHVEIAHANRAVQIQDGSSVQHAVIRQARDAGVFLSGSARDNVIEDVAMSDLGRYGLWLAGAQGTQAADVTVDGCGQAGLQMDASSTLTLERGAFRGCGRCGGMLTSATATFSEVHFDGNTECGLFAQGGQVNATDGSMRANGAEGFFALEAVAGSVERHQIVDNGREGVRLQVRNNNNPTVAVRRSNIHGNGGQGSTTYAYVNPALAVSDSLNDGRVSTSGTWRAPDGGRILAAQVSFSEGGPLRNNGYLRDVRGVTLRSFSRDANEWVPLGDGQEGLQVAAERNTNVGQAPTMRVLALLYRADNGGVRQITVGHLGAASDARDNYLGDFPLVLDDVQFSQPSRLDFQGFMGVPFADDWAFGPYMGRAITEPTVWRGTVWLTGDVSVDVGASLQIEAGTTVRVAPIDQDGDGVGEYTLTARGALVLDGTADAPVRFVPDVPSDIDGRAWQGIDVYGPDSRLSHTQVVGAEVGLDARGAGFLAADLTVRDGHIGLVANGGEPRFERLRSLANTVDGVRLLAPATVAGAVIQGNGERGVWIDSASTLEDATVTDSGTRGVDVTALGAALHFCDISGSGEDGVVVTGLASVVLTDSDIQANGGAGVWFQATGSNLEPSGTVNRCNLFGNAPAGGPGANGMGSASANTSANDVLNDGRVTESGTYVAPGPIERAQVRFSEGGPLRNTGGLRR
ncbi:MAG: right-handed parallel beta-helix repeat-containing protein, partial [Myxococcales bacterium]|nr:right-handed parallel beta-helix repeat-containing protein [Myxococcales bacterium]